MKHDPVDRLLQLAYLEGVISTRRAYETSVSHSQPDITVSEARQHALESKLEEKLKGSGGLTVGSLLQQVRSGQSIRSAEISSRIGLPANIYRMLEHDRISPLKIPVEAWRKIHTLLNISIDDLVAMIRRTHQLVFFRPAFRTTLARYDGRKTRGTKSSTLEKAASEMYARARLDLPAEEQQKIEVLIRTLTNGK